jgi:peptidoglycan DL-endopeptidase CwlO
VPSGLVAALTTPLRELQAAVGTGAFPADDPVTMLRDASRVLTDVAASGTAVAGQLGGAWSGLAADAATRTLSMALGGAAELAAHASNMAGRVGAASDAVVRAKARLQRIVEDFEATARALESGLPQNAGALIEAARQALSDAAGVVAELEDELDGHAAAVTESGAAAMPAAPTSPVGMMSSALPATATMPATLSSGALSGMTPAAFDDAMLGPDTSGSGVAVRLPDGSSAMAPNAVAADAVRHALTQLGVPYDWGGTAPGVGLDCSGLTQWAYHEAGLDLPRLAQEQDIGAHVSPGGLLPGDLAVWDNHVAMIVGDGMMIEAGDPVQLSPIRTTNAGQGFQGFWRPTA